MDNRVATLLSRIEKLASISDHTSAITRTFGSPAFAQASEVLYKWFCAAGLDTRIDNIGNVRGRLHSLNPKAKTFVIASHADTVVNAGRFDGPLGVLLGLDIAEQLAAGGQPLPFHLELIAFSDEEGVRFHTTYLGSKVVAGSFSNDLLAKKDRDGITLQQAIEQIKGKPQHLAADAIAPNDWLGYFEIHIEQGPVLYEADIPVAVVSSIAGQRRASVTITGEAGHAGTVPMAMRHDALCCAAECISAIEQYAHNNHHVLATVGSLHIHNQASNVIPGRVNFSIDIRSAGDDDLETAWHEITAIITGIAHRRNVDANIQLVQSSLPVKCDYHLSFLIKRAINQAGYPVKELLSGAGHDAVPVSQVAPVCMLFVRCFKGISHNPLENVEPKDVAAAIAVSDIFIQNLVNYYNQP